MSDASPFIRYVVTDADGAILRKGNCRPGDLSSQAGPGETAIEFDHLKNPLDDRLHRIVSGNRQDIYTQQQLDAAEQAERDQRAARRQEIFRLRQKLQAIQDPDLRELITHLFRERHG